MNLQNIPFYVTWTNYTNFINTHFPTLVIDDSALFLGYLFINVSFIFLLYLMIKLVKFVVVLCKNIIYR